MRAAFLAVPKSLEEAAFIDGANHLTVLFKVLVPLVKATIAVIVLYSAVGHWNSWFNAMIYIQDTTKFPPAAGFKVYSYTKRYITDDPVNRRYQPCKYQRNH